MDPKHSKGLIFRHRATSCSIDDVASCELLSTREKSGGYPSFLLDALIMPTH